MKMRTLKIERFSDSAIVEQTPLVLLKLKGCDVALMSDGIYYWVNRYRDEAVNSDRKSVPFGPHTHYLLF